MRPIQPGIPVCRIVGVYHGLIEARVCHFEKPLKLAGLSCIDQRNGVHTAAIVNEQGPDLYPVGVPETSRFIGTSAHGDNVGLEQNLPGRTPQNDMGRRSKDIHHKTGQFQEDSVAAGEVPTGDDPLGDEGLVCRLPLPKGPQGRDFQQGWRIKVQGGGKGRASWS